jgi:hypothetical protein
VILLQWGDFRPRFGRWLHARQIFYPPKKIRRRAAAKAGQGGGAGGQAGH